MEPTPFSCQPYHSSFLRPSLQPLLRNMQTHAQVKKSTSYKYKLGHHVCLCLTWILSRKSKPIKYGRIIPMVVPTIIMTKPQPYPNIIPASHMEGPEGIRNTGNKAREATSISASTGRPNAVASHCNNGKRT